MTSYDDVIHAPRHTSQEEAKVAAALELAVVTALEYPTGRAASSRSAGPRALRGAPEDHKVLPQLESKSGNIFYTARGGASPYLGHLLVAPLHSSCTSTANLRTETLATQTQRKTRSEKGRHLQMSNI